MEVLNWDHGHILAKVSGRGVFHAFRNETGQHCCQRVPPTERHGRRHTSVISVGVLPLRSENDAPLRESEIEVTAQCGKLTCGGQHAQKNATAIRARHIPTGIVVFIQNERSQRQNREEALRILAARVNDAKRAKEDAEYAEFRRKQLGDGRRGSKVRTYNFIDSRVADHQLGKKTTRIDEVMRGRFDLLF